MQTISPNTLSSIRYYKDIPVFRYSIRYPVFTSDCSRAAAARINAHYADLAAGKEDYCRTVLYPQAVEAARYIQDNHPPFEMYGFTSDYEVTFNSGCITSLYTDESAYMGGAHGSVTRSSDTWDFASGKRLQLGDFYPGQPFFSQGIIQHLLPAIRYCPLWGRYPGIPHPIQPGQSPIYKTSGCRKQSITITVVPGPYIYPAALSAS